MSKVKELETLYKKIETLNEELKRNEYALDLELENTEEQDSILIFDLREKISKNYKELGELNEKFFELENEIANNELTSSNKLEDDIEKAKKTDIQNGFFDL